MKSSIRTILDDAKRGKAPSKDAIIEMLYLDENASETMEVRKVANELMRKKFDNKALPLGQIGIEIMPCPANCKFCAFAEDVNQANIILTDEEVLAKARDLTASGEIYALFLMTMHNFDKERLLRICDIVRREIPEKIKLVVNIGDADYDYFMSLKKLGVSGAYHALRLREGIDNTLNPCDRRATLDAIKRAGLALYSCCEPIGAEHTNEEIAEQMMIASEFKCFQNAAMARVNFAGSKLEKFPEISKTRLAQIVAITSLSSLENEEMKSMGMHEPDMQSLMSGANSLSAETGKNPRDTASDTTGHRGKSVEEIMAMFRSANFDFNF